MILKIIKHDNGINNISYDLSKLTNEELDFAKSMWQMGWNNFMSILPNITPDPLLVDGKFPYNRDYNDGKQPLVSYFSAGLRKFDKK